ncbi:tetratricopeptide repeat protein [Kitasatospora sp. NPDC058162]|uniref:tetratricopeptide repeat protein n=1 Tax=Kitasatospora sp. NPDC058162 TaxID=3346362 RepID=UPI0036DA84A2
MDKDALDYWTRTQSGCIPPDLASRLLELGHATEVEFQAGRGEWFCAREWARLLDGQGRPEEALAVLAPYTATGWWTAAEATAELLEARGRVDEAIALARPHAEGGSPLAMNSFARMLARHGRADEAFTLLRPYVADWFLAQALVDVAAGTGRDEEAAELLTARIGAVSPCPTDSCAGHPVGPFNAVGLLASIRERQGRVDEAIALLHTRDSTSVNDRNQLADLLARHDRIEELRAYAATDHHGHAARRLAELLEERGDVAGAVGVYRRIDDSSVGRHTVAVDFAQLLARHGRYEEAIAVMRTLSDAPGGAEDWILDTLRTLYTDQGRPRDGLAYLDALKARRGGEEWEVFWVRLPLMAACDRVDEAVEQARAHPEGDTWYAASHVARMLADAGRTEEAVAVLRPCAPANRHDLARYLIDLGRVAEAVTLLQEPVPVPARTTWVGSYCDEPPF